MYICSQGFHLGGGGGGGGGHSPPPLRVATNHIRNTCGNKRFEWKQYLNRKFCSFSTHKLYIFSFTLRAGRVHTLGLSTYAISGIHVRVAMSIVLMDYTIYVHKISKRFLMVLYTCTYFNRCAHKVWSQKPPETLSEIEKLKIFLGEHAPRPP